MYNTLVKRPRGVWCGRFRCRSCLHADGVLKAGCEHLWFSCRRVPGIGRCWSGIFEYIGLRTTSCGIYGSGGVRGEYDEGLRERCACTCCGHGRVGGFMLWLCLVSGPSAGDVAGAGLGVVVRQPGKINAVLVGVREFQKHAALQGDAPPRVLSALS